MDSSCVFAMIADAPTHSQIFLNMFFSVYLSLENRLYVFVYCVSLSLSLLFISNIPGVLLPEASLRLFLSSTIGLLS